MQKHRLSVTLAALLLTVYSIQSQAGLTFTDKTNFLAALPGPAGVLNFDSLAGGLILSNTTQAVTGGPGTGITFPASVTDWQNLTHQLQVVANVGNNNPTTSNPNSLGTDDAGNYHTIVGGTVINLGLTSPVNALGLSFITPDTMYDDDILLVAGGDTASLDAGVRTLVGNFNGSAYYAYFLGVIETTGFSSASIQYGPNVSGGPFLYNADDITVAVTATGVPEPSTLVLLFGGVPAWLLRRSRRT
ncbi:MAG: PEP-CTERM sorting domain-containing protein [Candidatus Competibacteraceae bacterium]